MLIWTLHGWLYRRMPQTLSDEKIEQALGAAGSHLRAGLFALGERLAATPGLISAGAGQVFARALGVAPRRR